MKKLIVLFSAIVFSISVFDEPSILETIQASFKNDNEIIIENRNTFDLVFVNGAWWIYEYDQDAKLINMYLAE